jgi:RNA-binding protein
MTLSGKQTQHLRGLAHSLKPVVMIGDKGLTENVLNEIDGALNFHELIKVKIPAGDKASKDSLIQSIVDASGAVCVQSIGRIAALYRPSENKKITLPK